MGCFNVTAGSGEKVTIDGVKAYRAMNLISSTAHTALNDLPGDFLDDALIVYDDKLCSVSVNGVAYWEPDSWTAITSLPVGANNEDGVLAAVLNGSLYVIAKLNNTYPYLYRYASGSWEELSICSFIFDIRRSSLVVYNGQIHCFYYGYENSKYQLGHKIWNGSAWVSSTVPHSYTKPSVAVFDGKIHLVGGQNNGVIATHYAWNGSAWEQLGGLPCNTDGGFSELFEFENRLHLLAGVNHYKWDGSVWTKLNDLPYSLSGSGAVGIGNKIHLAGGNENLRKHYILDEFWYKEV